MMWEAEEVAVWIEEEAEACKVMALLDATYEGYCCMT